MPRLLALAMSKLSTFTAIAATIIAALSPAQAADTVIQKWSGNGLLNTRPFTTTGPWELQWDSSGLMQVFMSNANGDDQEVIANQVSGGHGTSYIPKPGTYLLKFNALGKWSAQAVLVSP